MWFIYFSALARSSLRRRLLGAARVCVYIGVLTGIAAAFAAKSAVGQIREQTRALGRQLEPLAELVKGTTEFRINGQSVFFAVSTLGDATVSGVLDRVQAHCEDEPSPLAKEMDGLANALSDSVGLEREMKRLLRKVALHRDETEEEGTIVCFSGEGLSAPTRPVGEHFETSRDLAALGKLRYFTVTRGKAAQERNKVRVLALWTDGSFRLDAFEPPLTGDAPGTDSKLVSRPPGSARILSAESVGAKYALRMYETNADPAEVLRFYDRTLGNGYGRTPEGDEHGARGYLLDGLPILVNVSRDETKTVVAVSELGGDGADASLRRAPGLVLP